jgi:hypothetical protein
MDVLTSTLETKVDIQGKVIKIHQYGNSAIVQQLEIPIELWDSFTKKISEEIKRRKEIADATYRNNPPQIGR